MGYHYEVNIKFYRLPLTSHNNLNGTKNDKQYVETCPERVALPGCKKKVTLFTCRKVSNLRLNIENHKVTCFWRYFFISAPNDFQKGYTVE